MARSFRRSLALGIVGWALFVGCSDESSPSDDGTGGSDASSSSSSASTGTGASSASSSASSSSSTSGSASGGASDGGGGAGGSADGGAGGAPGCTEITVDELKLFVSGGASGYAGPVMPALGGADDDRLQVELYDDTLTGSIDLGSGIHANYETCTACVLAYEDVTTDDVAKIYFQSGGTLDLGTTTAPFIAGSLTDVTLIEVTIDPDTFESTPVAGGGCLHLASLNIDIVPPPVGWTCAPEYYGDAAVCDCECGVADVDCQDVALPIAGCEDGQTCSAAGTCEGAPTGWTCAADQYDGGAGNGCDCNCGVYDPDCDIAAEPIEGCQAAEQCNSSGACVPAAWTCNVQFFGDGECDCGCGAFDQIDCTDATVGSCDWCNDTGSCSSTVCPGTINPTNNAVCS